MSRQTVLIQALAEIESALEQLDDVAKSLDDGGRSLVGNSFEELGHCVDALVLADLLRSAMTVRLRSVLSCLVESGDAFMHRDALLEQTGLENESSLSSVMAQFLRRRARFDHSHWTELFEEKEHGLLRLKPHYMGVVKEFLDEH